jgi:hypothetical protein
MTLVFRLMNDIGAFRSGFFTGFILVPLFPHLIVSRFLEG